ncbi:glycosyl transferase family protein [Parapedobacter pyrenivorans]|uniref:Glycosyl transferase family protein n=1 Tax=Parapedobacter pyrenivorans TaxID=1305674 RepID=A0A917M4L9_9SPHI|nr:glycosyl transferase family protein [Parapedobacter pyrenivorans]
MRANKITRWIDRKNLAVSLIIARKYYRSKALGKLPPILKPAFLLAIIQRFFFLGLSLFRFNGGLFVDYKGLTISEFGRRLLGIGKFDIPGLLPVPTSFDAFSFPTWEIPQVSIIVCVHNHIAFTYNCLLSILNNTKNNSYEVVIVNDCSTDETKDVLSSIGNVHVIENEKNIGFLKSCNKALASSKGTYICFLNNDVQVLPGWLDNLVAPFENFDRVGLVGAKLIYPFGLLQEAGGIVNYKGEPGNYGKFKDPQDIFYNYLREADYCSGACILALKTDLIELDGFDEAFAPAYYEDTDLAFRIRYQLNKKVYYQPLAQVVHFEGVSSGKISDGKNVKSYQVVNAEMFKARWQYIFQGFPQTTDAATIARKFVQKDKYILIVEPSLPTFDQDSGSRRMFELIKLLLRLNWSVIFSSGRDTQQEPYYSTLVNMGVWVLNKPSFQKSSKNVLKRVIQWVDVAWVCRPGTNRRYGRFIKKFGVRWINDTVDIHFLREERALKMGMMSQRKSRKVARRKRRELSLLHDADTVVAITDVEADLLSSYGVSRVVVIPNVHHPISVEQPAFDTRKGICFIGSYRHLPNIDAATWLVNEIMPLVWEKLPSIPLYLLGNEPTKQVIGLKSENVYVPGYLADVSPYFLSSRVFVAPLRFGAGMKGKIGQSLEFGLPTVTTDIGAEGMGLIDRKHYLRANTAEQFATAILDLYSNEQLWSEIAAGTRDALTPYAPERVKNLLIEVLQQ